MSIWVWSQRELEIVSMPKVIKQNQLFSQESFEVLITKFTDQRFLEWGKYKLNESPELNSKVWFFSDCGIQLCHYKDCSLVGDASIEC